MARKKVRDDFGIPTEVSIEADRQRITEEPKYNFDYSSSKIYFPKELVPEGKTYVFIREYLNNEPDQLNISQHYHMGYRFVLAADHPEFIIPKMNHHFQRGNDDGYIHMGGQILMWIPTEEFNRRQDFYNRQSQENKRNAEAATAFVDSSLPSVPRMVLQNETQSSYSPMYNQLQGR